MNRDKSEGCRNRVQENTWDLNILSHLKTQPHHWGESAPCPDLLHSFFWTYCRQHHVYLLLQAWVVLGWVNSSWAPRDTFFLKMVSFFFSPLLSPPPLSAFSVPLIIILATNKSGFPLSNQIIPAVLDLAGIWCRQILACSLWRCADQARPDAQMLLFCNHICAEVWRWESRFQQCLILVSGALWHFHQGSRWWQRDDPHYDCRSPKFKCKQNSSSQDNLNLK